MTTPNHSIRMKSAPPRPKLLLADSELRTSRRLAALLSEDGFEVEVVRDGALAMARLAESAPDAVVTELDLPLADGGQVVRFARSHWPGIRVVVVTRYPHLAKLKGVGDPVPTLITKPLDYASLLEALRAPAPVRNSGAPAASIKPAGARW